MTQPIILAKGRTSADRACAFLQSLPLDKAWEVVVREYRRKRSDAQNAALFGYAYKVLSEHTGYTLPEIHEVMLRSYFGEVENEIMGRVISKPRRTTTTDERGKRSVLTTVEFSDFFAHVQREASKIGCFIDDPSLDHYLREDAA